jgi:amino acid adenylation domain-containing protein
MSFRRNEGSGSGTTPLTLPFARRPNVDVPTALESLQIPINTEVFTQLLSVAPDLDLVLLGVWQTLLWRFTDQSDVIVGWVGHDRTQDQSRAAMESHTRVIPIAATFSADLTVADVVQQLQKAKARAEEPQANLQHDAAQLPVGFLIEKVSGRATVPSYYPSCFQMLLRVQTDLESWNVELLYDRACFRPDVAERIGRTYATMVLGLAANPNSRVDALPMLDAQDHKQVVNTFNQTAVPYPKDKCVHELFEEQVKRTPHHTALRFHEQTFSYHELNVRANQLAHFLRRRGVGPNVPAALFVERSAEMIIGLLGIIKAGGCYVPLVHDDPQARLAYLLTETQPTVLLTSRKLRPRLPDYSGEIVLLDESFDAEPGSDPENRTKSSDLVCVIYTSGSTGVPKGVAARHSNLANYILFICERLGLSRYPEGLHFASVSTISAILGNTSVFGSLMSGGCLHVIDYETAMAPNLFADYVAAHPIDVMKITPSQLSTLLSGSEGKSVLPRKYVVVGGEKFTWELLQQIRDRGTCIVMNHYGPTETMGCCTFIVDDYIFDGWRPATVPLGLPMSNQQLYILDPHLRPVPIGVPGELCMSGAGLTDGYFNQPQQTAERFVANPFSKEPSARLYRTGDLARFLPDGNIEYLGRIDHQVKIRGFRVEPEEVEAALKLHPDINQAVIVPEDGQSGEKLLAAYVVPTKTLDRGELRSFLRQHLPDYMIPSRLLMLKALPLNRNGKVDLPALAALSDEGESGMEREFVVPRNPMEEQLAEIWAEVLQQERVGVHDDFFELGGHSLLATQIISRIRNAFRVQFPLLTFLENPTIADMAVGISQFPAVETEDEEMERLLRELEEMSDEERERLPAPGMEKDAAAGGGTTG